MIIDLPNFYILSGGPGAGKTTTLEALRARGFACVDEAARQILKEQKASGGDATHDGDRVKYRDLTLSRSRRYFSRSASGSKPRLLGASGRSAVRLASVVSAMACVPWGCGHENQTLVL